VLFLVWGNKHWSIQSIFPATHEWDSASFPANLLPGYIILQFNSPSSAFHFLFINYSLICNHNLNCLTSIVKCHFSYFLGQWMKHEASKGKRMQCVFVFVHACACVCVFFLKNAFVLFQQSECDDRNLHILLGVIVWSPFSFCIYGMRYLSYLNALICTILCYVNFDAFGIDWPAILLVVF